MQLIDDVRYAVRSLRKSPAFALTALAALALGIGASATVFTVADAWLFKDVPFDRGERVIFITSRNSLRPEQVAGISYPDFRDWRVHARTLEQLGAVGVAVATVVDDRSLPEVYPSAQVTANSFRTVGQRPIIGRDFADADEAPGALPVAMLTYGLWDRRYGQDPSVIGRSIRVNGIPTTIIGVMPAGFAFPVNVDLWTVLTPTPMLERRDARILGVFGRMREGSTIESVRADLDTLTRSLERAYPDTNRGITASALPYREQFIGTYYPTLFAGLLVAVGFVLLIACSNVAHLQLLRAVQRSRETSIRMALGAGSWHIVRQRLAESVLLSIVGGVVGWWIAAGGVRAIDLALTALGKPRWLDISMDVRSFLFLAAVSIGVGILSGTAPALGLSRISLHTDLKEGSRAVGGDGRRSRLHGLLAIGELAMAVILLTGAGLMVRNFLEVYRAPLGVSADNVLTIRLGGLPPSRYLGAEKQAAFDGALRDRLTAVPGVESVAIGTGLPATGTTPLSYEVDGEPPADAARRPTLSAVVISPDYFRVWGVAAQRGRFFTDVDRAGAPLVAIVNESFALQVWRGADPIGRRLRVVTGRSEEPWVTIVGQVPNIVHSIPRKPIDPVVYFPFQQRPSPGIYVLARTTVEPDALFSAFRREIHALDPDLPLFDIFSMDERSDAPASVRNSLPCCSRRLPAWAC